MAKMKKKTKETPVALDSTALGDERIAYELIKLFAGAMKALNGGVLPIPLNWQEHLGNSLNPNPQVGRLPKAATNKRKIMLAKGVIQETIHAQKTGKRPSLKGLKHSPDSKNIHRDIKNHMGDAAAELLIEEKNKREEQAYRERAERLLPIRQRIEKGESAWDLLLDPNVTTEQYAAARNFEERGVPLEGFPPRDILTERQKAIAWTSDGMNRHIHAPDEYQTFILEDDTDKEIAEVATSRNKKPR